jgi:hypothetical protein
MYRPFPDGSRREVELRKTTALIVAAIEGSFGLQVLGRFLDSLRAPPRNTTKAKRTLKRR